MFVIFVLCIKSDIRLCELLPKALSTILSLKHFETLFADLHIVLVNQEFYKVHGDPDLLSIFIELLIMVWIWILLVKFLIFQKHNGYCEIEYEEWANDDAEQKINVYEPNVIGIL